MATVCDPAATAKPELAPHHHLHSAHPAGAAGNVCEIYYDDGTSYLGYVGDRSICSSDEGDCDSTDSDFEARLDLPRQHASPNREQPEKPVRRHRHNVYSHRVMPEWAYFFTAPPPVAVADAWVANYVVDQDQPLTEAAAGDVAAMAEVMDYNNMVPSAYDDEMMSHSYAPADKPVPQAAGPAAGGVMCCYYKQGHCSMGSSCWYAHDGLASTPCHYGAACRKGHRHLVRANPNPPVPKQQQQQQQQQEVVPKRYVHEPKASRPAAPLLNTDMACPHCNETGKVRTQDFPMFEGNRVRNATRAHCGGCMRTFLLS